MWSTLCPPSLLPTPLHIAPSWQHLMQTWTIFSLEAMACLTPHWKRLAVTWAHIKTKYETMNDYNFFCLFGSMQVFLQLTNGGPEGEYQPLSISETVSDTSSIDSIPSDSNDSSCNLGDKISELYFFFIAQFNYCLFSLAVFQLWYFSFLFIT